MSQRYIGGVVTETTNVAQSPWTGEWTQQAALQGFAGAQAPLKVANSLRFRSSASAYLNRTPASAGNRTTWTWSGWVKFGSLSTYAHLFYAYQGSGASDSNYFRIFNAGNLGDNALSVGGGTTNWLKTTQVLRDPSAWYHIVLSVDTTQATAANRLRLYINGSQITAFATATYPAQNSTLAINGAWNHNIALGDSGNYFDGYLTEINFIDGQALPPTAFGTFSKENGVWSPSAYTGTYGTNGFKLNFSNGTSTTTLGYDSSGNGNNWTTNNISLTAGSTYDWMIDSPTKYPGSSYGVGNYCVLMPFTVCNAVSAGWGTSSASDGNLNYSSISSVSNSWSSFALPLSGKYYAEMRFSSLTTGSTGVLAYDGNANRSVIFYQNGTVYNNNVLSQSLTAWSSGDTIGLAINMDASTIQFYRNGSAVGTAESITVAYGKYFIFNRYQAYLEANFGQRPFAYTPPSGYKSLCTQNLPGVTIQNGAQYMAASLYTGSGAAMNISDAVNGVSFQPDFVWLKCRSSARINGLWDSVRGATKYLSSNSTDAEATDATNGVISFQSNGYTVGATGTWNFSGDTFVGWQWKAGGTAVTNTAGSITSSVSANTTSGFSVVTYTGNGTNPGATIGHGLGATPSMIITKARNTAGTWWPTYHSALPISNTLYLNDTVASTTYVNRFSAVSSTTFTTGSNGSELNTNAVTYVAYCFAAIPGYSAFGSYTGNGSSDGPFVYCGFRPRFVMVKCSSAVSDWTVVDTSRSPYNLSSATLFPNASAAEGAGFQLDILSNGFKLRATGVNTSSATYIYAAFAENPFQNALAR